MNQTITLNLRHPELENPALTHINRLPPRSNLIPAMQSGVYYKNKEDSSLLQSLSGVYRFLYFEEDCAVDFFRSEYDDTAWDTIDVPSMWQYRGYGKCCYPNIDYPIPFDPPYVRCPNPVGYYRRRFQAAPGGRTILHFGGVDNAFYVYLNGTFVGFSKGSRNPAEFDVSNLIREGENLLAVKVFTYSDATYLENQDMLLASGIFRDVYLLHTDRISLWDYRVTTDLKGFTLALELTEGADDCTVEIRIADQIRRFAAAREITTYFPIDEPRLWNSEEPNLYDLTIRLYRGEHLLELHSKRIGMLHSRIEGNKLLVNGQPVYIKGINRHEHDCDNGRAISVALIEKELQMIKANHINAIRCSHYTNHPAFYEICSELGIFVMDEADLETHGCGVTGDQGYLSKRPEWLPAYLDRVERMLKQNKNEACIFMHSMGNECGAGDNIIECLRYTLAYEPDKVAIHDQERAHDIPADNIPGSYDFLERAGYLSAAALQELIDQQPISMQIEYAHAMGNSPGFLEGYQRFVYENDSYLGGFVWEFKNHGFHQKDDQGRDYYLYGGDFGDIDHWYNFCLDGYLMSDGTPKHSWYELGEVFAPVYVTYDGAIHLKNTFNFRDLNSLTCEWELCEDYQSIAKGQLPLPSVAPHAEVVLKLDQLLSGCSAASDCTSCPADPDCAFGHPGSTRYLNLHFYDRGVPAGSHQILLTEAIRKPPFTPAVLFTPAAPSIPAASVPRVTVSGQTLTVSGSGFEIQFTGGNLSKYICRDKTLLDSPLTFCLYRAPIDNDGILGVTAPDFYREALEWNLGCLDKVYLSYTEITAEQHDTMILCRAKGKALPTAKAFGFRIDTEYRIYPGGLLLIDMKAVPYGKFPSTLPRIGLHFDIDASYDQVTWYGRGERENYSDCKKASPMGLYSRPLAETYTIYDMPQDTGNHEDTAYMSLTNASGEGLTVIGCDRFAFSCHDFTLENLTKALHKNELVKDDHNHLYIDYKMRGLGSHSCGPLPEEEFEFRAHAFEFAFVLAGNITREQALELVRSDFGVHTHALTPEEIATFSGICAGEDPLRQAAVLQGTVPSTAHSTASAPIQLL